MVLLSTTPTILKAISSLPPTSPFHTSNSHTTLPTQAGQPISHSTLLALSKCTSNTLNTLLRGTKPYTVPRPPKPEPSPEYKALMSKLRADQERREYRALLHQREHELHSQGEDEEDQGSDDISPSLVLNMLLSVVMCAGVAFHLTRWWPNDGVRVLVSLGTGIVVGVAEVTVYAAYLRKVEESRVRERKTKERKVVIGEYTGKEGEGATEPSEGRAEVEKMEIWGRGLQGGMRQRVRDRWAKEQTQE